MGGGVSGNALSSTDGTSGAWGNYALFSGKQDLTVADNFTYSFWFYGNDPSYTHRFPIYTSNQYRINFANSTSIFAYMVINGDVNNGCRIAAGITIDDNKWHHVLVTFSTESGTNNRTNKLYVDTELKDSGACSGTINTTPVDLRIGNTGHSKIDLVRFYDTALTDDMISFLYQEEKRMLALSE